MERLRWRHDHLVLGLLISGVATMVSLPGVAQDSQPDAPRERSIFVSVRDGGEFVRGLTADDFELREEGRIRPVTVRSPDPATVVLLVEMSRATRLIIQDVNAALTGFAQSAPEGHWYALASYADELSIVEDFTRRPPELIRALPRIRLPQDDNYRTFDAIQNVVERLALLGGRPVLIAITTGFDRGSATSQPTLIGVLDSTNVQVYALALGTEARRAGRVNMTRSREFLQRLARRSGGQVFFPLDTSQFYPAMARVFDTLSAQYELVYVPGVADDDPYHRIEVNAFRTVDGGDRRRLEVQAREGWR